VLQDRPGQDRVINPLRGRAVALSQYFPTAMKLSKYCKTYPLSDDPGSLILFSTKNASIINVPKYLSEDLEKNGLTPEEQETLQELGFLVRDVLEEKKEILGFIDELNALNKRFDAIVVMDLDCNLACKYCFEGQRKGKFYMTTETADRLVDFIKENVPQNTEEIGITFYGGEPLLSTGLIAYISGKLKSLAEGNGTIYNAGLITNGTLLTPKVVEKLKPFGLAKASVTLDGPKSVHDKYRPFKSGKGSFDAIVRNINGVCEMVEVQLGGNFTREDYREFPLLLDYLTDAGLTPDKISDVQFFPVFNETEGVAPHDFHDGCSTINEPWIMEAGVFLREETLKRGYRTGKITPVICMMDHINKIAVNYNGDIYKCPGMIGRDEFKVGHISSGIMDYKQSHNLDNWKNDKCLDCEYLPLCFGGCRYLKLVRDGKMNGVDCKKPYLDATLRALVMQDIKYGLKS